MKRNAFNVIISIILLIASLASFASAAFGGLECYMLRELEKGLPAAEEIADVEEAINLIAENEDEYLEGVELCYEGDVKILQGRAIINEGKSQLAYSEEEIAAAQAQYDDAVAQLADAQAQVDEAKAQMEEARPDYEEGKSQLAKLEKVQPLLEEYVYFKNNTLENYDGFNSLNAWYIAVVIPYLMTLGLELPSDMDAFTESMAQQIEEGNAMLEEYENAEAQLNEAQAQIDEANAQLDEAKAVLDMGYSAIDEGYEEIRTAENQLSYAAGQLAEGKATLEEFEDAIGQVETAISELMKLEPVCDRLGNVAVKGVSERLGDDFDIYKYNEEGEMLSLPNGNPRVDYEKCLKVCDAYRDYMNDYKDSLHREFILRVIFDAALLLVSVFAFVAAIKALRGKEKAAKMSVILLAALIALNVCGMAMGYASFAHPDGEETYSGLIPFAGAVLLTLVSAVFALACRKGRKKYLAEKAVKDAELALQEKAKALEERKARIAEIVAEVEGKKNAEAEAAAKVELKAAEQREERKNRIAEIVAEVEAKKAAEAEAAAEAEKTAAEIAVEEVTAEVTEEVTEEAAEDADLVTVSVSDVEIKMTAAERSDYDKAKAEYEEALKKYLELRKKYSDK